MWKVEIIKYPDEWFYIVIFPNTYLTTDRNAYFKCDQIDGLIHCLYDYFNIRNQYIDI